MGAALLLFILEGKNSLGRGWGAQFNTPEVGDPVLPEQSCSLFS